MLKLMMKLIPVLAVVLLFFAGCNKESSASGNIYGFISLDDQYGSPVTTGLSGATVTLNGKTTTTNSSGMYTFNNQTAGEYTISVTQSGYGAINGATFQFTGGGNLDHDGKLSAIPNFNDSLLAVTGDADTITLSGTLSGNETRRTTVAVFVGNSSSTSSTPANYLRDYIVTTNNNSFNTFTLNIPVSDLTDLGFTAGQTVYFAVYGAATNFASTSDYEDLTTGREWYTALSTTPFTATSIMP